MVTIPSGGDEFLGSLTFEKPNPDSKALVRLRGAIDKKDVFGQQSKNPPTDLFQREITKMGLAGLRNIILNALRSADHAASDDIANSILGIAVKSVSSGSQRAAFLSEILNSFRAVETSHFYITPHPLDLGAINMEGFTMSALNIPVLRSRCARAKSNYAQLYSDRHGGLMTLQSPDYSRVVIDVLTPSFETEIMSTSAGRDIILNYFDRIAASHFESMWNELDRIQTLGAPFRANILDVENLRNTYDGMAKRVTIYLGVNGKDIGYVVPVDGCLVMNQPGPDSEAYRRFCAHRETYKLSEVGDSELGRVLFAVGGFCQQAVRLFESGRLNDAALYATICLEQLFSEKTSTSKAVASRTACVTHLRLAASYKAAVEEMAKLYDARSKFVHTGKSVTFEQAERLIEYAREVIRSLLVLHLREDNRKEGFLDTWRKDIDFVSAGFDADRAFENSFLADVGIFRE